MSIVLIGLTYALIGTAGIFSAKHRLLALLLLAGALTVSLVSIARGDIAIALSACLIGAAGIAVLAGLKSWIPLLLTTAATINGAALLLVALRQYLRSDLDYCFVLTTIGLLSLLGAMVVTYDFFQIRFKRRCFLMLVITTMAAAAFLGSSIATDSEAVEDPTGNSQTTPARMAAGMQIFGESEVPSLLRLLLIASGAAWAVSRIRRAGMWDSVLRDAPSAFLLVDRQGRIESASGNCESVTGYSPNEMVHLTISDLLSANISPQHHQNLMQQFWCSDSDQLDASRLIELRGKSGRVHFAYVRLLKVDSPGGPRAAVILNDATVEAQASRDAAANAKRLNETLNDMATQAHTDPLTGLLNRKGFLAELELRIARGPLVVMFVDIDHFKSINDGMSHAAGDQVLQEVAQRLRKATRNAGDVVGRIGGDEFVIALRTGNQGFGRQNANLNLFATRISNSINSRPVDIDGLMVPVTASVGAAASGRLSAIQVVHRAGLALHAAKETKDRASASTSGVATYTAAMGLAASKRLEKIATVTACVEAGCFDAWYQPVVDLDSYDIVGHEVLARCIKPSGTVMEAGEFLEPAEQAGLMSQVADQVLSGAFREFDHLPSHLAMAINASPRELSDPRFALLLRRSIDGYKIDPSRIVLEITEAGLFVLEGGAKLALWELVNEGVRLSLDDFGTGYSSISSLAEHPISGLKLDRSFTMALTAGDRSVDRTSELVAGLAVLGHSLGCDLIAEGIETTQQAEAVRNAGWPKGQGFLFSPASPSPLPVVSGSERLV